MAPAMERWRRARRDRRARKVITGNALDGLFEAVLYDTLDRDMPTVNEVVVLYLAVDQEDRTAGEARLQELCAAFPSQDVVDYWRNAGCSEETVRCLSRLRPRPQVELRDEFQDKSRNCARDLFAHSDYVQRTAYQRTAYEDWVQRVVRARLTLVPMVGARGGVMLQWEGISPEAVSDVFVDDVPMGPGWTVPTDRPIELPVGKHAVTVVPGHPYRDVRVEVDVREGQTDTLSLQLEEHPKARKIDILVVPSTIEEAPKLDGVDWHLRPIARGTSLGVGKHTMEVQAVGYRDMRKGFEVSPGENHPVVCKLEYAFGEGKPAGWLYRLKQTGNEDDDVTPLRFGTNLLGKAVAGWREAGVDVPLYWGEASRWHAEVVIQEPTFTPFPDRYRAPPIRFENEEAVPPASMHEVRLVVFGQQGLMVSGCHVSGRFSKRGQGNDWARLDHGSEIRFPPDPVNGYRLVMEDVKRQRGPGTPADLAPQGGDGWRLSWKSVDERCVGDQDISRYLRRYGTLSIGSGSCEAVIVQDDSLQEAHALLRVPAFDQDAEWLSLRLPGEAPSVPGRPRVPASLRPGDSFRLGDVDFTLARS